MTVILKDLDTKYGVLIDDATSVLCDEARIIIRCKDNRELSYSTDEYRLSSVKNW